MEFFGVRFIGVSAENAHKLLFTLAFLAVLASVRYIAGAISEKVLKAHPNEQLRFWTWQVISLFSGVLLLFGLVSIWFDDPQRLTTAMGLVTAGLAFALQKVITSFAAYFVILRGRSFGIGDRIAMGGVRGEVIALGFMQTKIMEIGQSLGEQPDAPALWIKSRQFTGRIVTVTNDKIFEQPVYNYTHEFPFLWEEISLPVAYRDDRHRAEQILLDAAARHTAELRRECEDALRGLRRHYTDLHAETKPQVYYRLTDNWLELTVRFISKAEGTRGLKDAMSREILSALDGAGIGIASATFEIVGVPPLQIQNGS